MSSGPATIDITTEINSDESRLDIQEAVNKINLARQPKLPPVIIAAPDMINLIELTELRNLIRRDGGAVNVYDTTPQIQIIVEKVDDPELDGRVPDENDSAYQSETESIVSLPKPEMAMSVVSSVETLPEAPVESSPQPMAIVQQLESSTVMTLLDVGPVYEPFPTS